MYVDKLPSGKWRWTVKHHGTRRSGTAPTRGEARLDGQQVEYELGSDLSVVSTDITVGVLLDEWQTNRAPPGPDKWSPTYAADMARVARALPANFLKRPVHKIRPPILAALYRQLEQEGWTPHRIHRVHHLFNGAFRMAVAHGWAAVNPGRDLTAPTLPRADIHPADHGTVRALIAAAPAGLSLCLRLAAITGARLGELVALRWDDLDSDGTLAIRRAIVWTPQSGLVVRDTTKTGRKGDRRLALDSGTITRLVEHHEAQEALAAAAAMPPPVWVFSHDAGETPWRPGYVGLEYRRLRARLAAELRRDGRTAAADRVTAARFHDLRHYVATSMLLDGEQPVDVAAQLGHATPATTLRVYARYLPGRGGESAVKRAGRLDEM